MFIYLLEGFVRDIFSFLNLHESNGEALCLPTACSRLFFFLQPSSCSHAYFNGVYTGLSIDSFHFNVFLKRI